MSITGTATLARVRSTTPSRKKVTRGDLGKAAGRDKDEGAKTLDVLVTMVPTSAVAFYTAALAWVLGAVDEPTRRQPNPDELLGWRWIVFAGLLLFAVGALLVSYYTKEPRPNRFPTAELAGTFVAAAAWGLATPGSVLFAELDQPERSFVPALIGAVGIGILAVMAPMLKRGARED